LILAIPSSALAAEIRQGETVVIGQSERIDDDLYAFGSSVTILGTVTGDVFAAGSSIWVGGTVNGGVYAAGSTVTLSGPIGEDAVLGSGTINIAPTARIGRDLLMGTGTAVVGAPVSRNVLVAGGDITLGGPVGGDVRGNIGTLRLANGSRVGGSLTYTSTRDAELAPGATITGPVQRVQPPAQPTQPAAWGIVDWLRGLVGVSILGLIVVGLFPRFTQRTVDTLSKSVWPSLAVGFAVLVGAPVLAILVFGFGLALGGWWLALPLLAAYATAAALGYALAALFVGRYVVRLLQQPAQAAAWNLIEGVALLGLVALVPFVGPFAVFIATVFGLGALTVSVAATYSQRQTNVYVPGTAASQANGVMSHVTIGGVK
jgi:hypothetical protein